MVLENGVKNIQAAAYNGARTVICLVPLKREVREQQGGQIKNKLKGDSWNLSHKPLGILRSSQALG